MGGRKHLHAKSKYCPGHACQQTLERFRENIHDQTPLPQIKTSDRCIFFPSPLLPIFTTHNEYSGWLYTNPAMKRNSFIFPLYILPFHPLAIQPLPLSEQISQFNFIVACGLKIVSSLRNDCDNQIVRAHVYLTWQVAAQISSTHKWRALFVLVCVFFFYQSCKLILKSEMRVGSSPSYNTSLVIKAQQPKWRTSWQLCKKYCLQIMPLGTRLPPRCCQEAGEGVAAWKWVNNLSGPLEGVKSRACWMWLLPSWWEGKERRTCFCHCS